jgi:hypothetical protein
MMMRSFTLLATLLTVNGAWAVAVPKDEAPQGKAFALNLTEKTETPAGVLKPGTYTIKIFESLADRKLIEITNADGSENEKFLSVPLHRPESGFTFGPVMEVGKKGKAALRGFWFTRATAVEFVYPKAAAVALAEANGRAVLAVDPASDGMLASAKDLSAADMKTVTLWSLVPSPVEPSQPHAAPQISASRYHSPDVRPEQVAVAKNPATISRLPKTASDLPLVLAAGAGSLLLAMGLMLRRRLTDATSAMEEY